MPDHPSWPAELVEKTARAICDQGVMMLDGTIGTWERNAGGFDHMARAVLSALSGDLVPREEHGRTGPSPEPTHICIDCGKLGYAGGYHDHGDGNAGDTDSLAGLLAAAKKGGEAIDRLAEMEAAPSQADALAEALERPIRSIEMLLDSDTTLPRDLRFDLTEAMNEGRDRLASYRSKPAPGETK